MNLQKNKLNEESMRNQLKMKIMHRPPLILLIFILLIAVFSFSVLAQEEGLPLVEGMTPEEKAQLAYANVYNPEDPRYFSWNWGDYSTITDWSKLSDAEWSKIPEHRIKEIPADQLDYSKLNAKQRKAMTAEQISVNFDKIEDLTADVNKEEAEKAIKEKYDVEVKLGKGAQLKNGVLSATYGEKGQVTLSGEHYQKGALKITEDGRIEFTPPDDATQIDIPQTDSVTIFAARPLEYTADKDSGIVDEQGNPVYYNVHKIEGFIHVDKGNFYVQRKKEGGFYTIIDNIEIEPLAERVDIYFDGQKHEGAYFSVNTQGRKMAFGRGAYVEEGYSLTFTEGNPFLEQGELYINNVLSYTDVAIEHRGGQKVPLITVEQKSPSTGGMSFINGYQRFVLAGFSVGKGVVEGEFRFDGIEESKKESAPFMLVFKVKEGESLLGQQVVIFDDDQNFAVVPESLAEKYLETQTKVLHKHTGEEIKKLIHTLTAKTELGAILRNLLLVPGSLRESINDVDVIPEEKVKEVCQAAASACMLPDSRTLVFEQGQAGNYATFYHEAIHAKAQKEMEMDHGPIFKELAKHTLILKAKYGENYLDKLTPGEITEWNALVEKYQQELSSEKTNRGKWEKVAGKVYSGYLDDAALSKKTQEWNYEPKLGCIRAYGCSNYDEDRATFAEAVIKHSPDYFTPLIAPPGHPKYDPKRYDSRYQKKLDLLHEFGDITNEQYEAIMETVKK